MAFMRDVAHVHDGFQVQTNSVSVNGTPGALMVIRKTGGVSTLAVIDGVRSAMRDIENVLPKGVAVAALFDQSVFVKAALDSVLLSACMAAALTALVIMLFLGNVRLSLIILAAIPLSIVAAVLVMDLAGQTLNIMTLGGFALAIGILVDNGTVVIENIERHVAMGEPLHQSIVVGANEVAVPTFLSTLCICIVFIPVFLLQGTSKYLFAPLSLSVIAALLASLALAFTMVPVSFNYLMAGSVRRYHEEGGAPGDRRASADQESVRSRSAGIRAFVRVLSRKVPQCACMDALAAGHDRDGVRRLDGALRSAVSAARAGFLSAGGRRPNAAARARASRHEDREDAAILCGGGIADSSSGRQ